MRSRLDLKGWCPAHVAADAQYKQLMVDGLSLAVEARVGHAIMAVTTFVRDAATVAVGIHPRSERASKENPVQFHQAIFGCLTYLLALLQ